MYNTTKVKTWQPIIPAGTGPVLLTADDAVEEILNDLGEQAKVKFRFTELLIMKRTVVDGLKITDWIDGEYPLFPDYAIKVHTYQQGQLDEMPEFGGY
ncbi:hypothetical protein DFQ01_103209 [Paenibacillus cellulosilyticus]|uniref:Uncharacterized protein n=1 Tax=Paenibacillus cellulosilyticus TaxID=375489 RepID=A0A2V2YX28_9BACL|nr:hypothetical protein [Paenibacillus cellulosilyticus]PWW06307.1 hypothetical protein DFQ01_103209 [Paenibacillus cellulosilyticus]QKS42948.1 hypothetical protein HUB94_00150 [Paenibacillus cellulosilyticus]QKS43471.1 hypothetical protein HUB94_02815 [Paenibacillus cellulosilyticus]QKS46332.1 hypothetical protein HUB94_19180 [Paenibacillus cellulosilyticus]